MMATESCIGQCGNDREGGEAFERSDSKAAGASKVVAVGVGGALDQAQHTQPTQLARQPGGREIGQQLYEVAARQSVDVEFGTLDCTQQRLIVEIEEVQALEGAISVGLGVRDALEQPSAAAVVVQAGEEFQIALIAAEQDVAQVDEAVDGLLEWSDFARCTAAAMFHLAVVLEERDIVGGGLDAQDAGELVVDLDRARVEFVFDASTLDACAQARADLRGQLRGEFLAQERGDVFGLDRQHGLARELLVKGSEDLLALEHQVGRIFGLHEAPVVRLTEDVEHGAAKLGVAVQVAVQQIGLEVSASSCARAKSAMRT